MPAPNGSVTMTENGEQYHNGKDMGLDADDSKMTDQNHNSDVVVQVEEVKKKYDPKDPFRPRRKKARRACYACQRAHLTCGDERPCQRCIKRGLADACQDGVRKKAKYLHDAPPEALLPVLGPNYNPNSPSTRQNEHNKPQVTQDSEPTSVAGSNFASIPGTNQSFPVYSTVQPPVSGMPEGLGFATQTSPVSPSFQTPRTSQLGVMGLSSIPDPIGISAIFDPSNPALFNFDLDNLNFGSQYPAMEFGILAQMSSGAADVNPSDPNMHTPPTSGVNFPGVFANSNNNPQYNGPLAYDGLPDFAAAIDSNSQNFGLQGTLQHGLPHAYAIAAQANSAGLASPSTETTASPQTNLFEGSPPTGHYALPAAGQNNNSAGQQAAAPHNNQSKTKSSMTKRGPSQSLLGKRRRDSSFIYETVKEPYPYTNGFHNLIAFLQKRFNPNKTLRIAKSLASIRPSFISCTKTLNRQDLIFMEKCFQRTLFEYEDFMQHCSAPTIVCRRTGEVAAVNKEFTALTGWTKDVLLGKEPNLNTNTGCATTNGNSSRVGMAPHLRPTTSYDTANGGEKRPQPVFIAELLDDDSAIEFYEDFAELAFENSRGKVNRKCRLLKYRPSAEGGSSSSAGTNSASKDGHSNRGSILSGRVATIDGEHGIRGIEKDGKVDCTYCWVIKRDVFDIPMLIVMNFLPCYYRNQGPRQLAV
ncbi:Transcription activator of gluconeogenesis [Scedosporium apiospermum]|uniref:Transcription activator of gluconeogenesis n=1 Tax=Pseudallescheria apiosperma TaxID=563466 RepID=A0A084FYW2_PSEDA|nr:Transcription activator of gluconeogenesis [Scedosporium apiospermum]KEZ40274.1 Transcription activator of gluconeogenesis [Scedosporium apiospermum]